MLQGRLKEEILNMRLQGACQYNLGFTVECADGADIYYLNVTFYDKDGNFIATRHYSDFYIGASSLKYNREYHLSEKDEWRDWAMNSALAELELI